MQKYHSDNSLVSCLAAGPDRVISITSILFLIPTIPERRHTALIMMESERYPGFEPRLHNVKLSYALGQRVVAAAGGAVAGEPPSGAT